MRATEPRLEIERHGTVAPRVQERADGPECQHPALPEERHVLAEIELPPVEPVAVRTAVEQAVADTIRPARSRVPFRLVTHLGEQLIADVLRRVIQTRCLRLGEQLLDRRYQSVLPLAQARGHILDATAEAQPASGPRPAGKGNRRILVAIAGPIFEPRVGTGAVVVDTREVLPPGRRGDEDASARQTGKERLHLRLPVPPERPGRADRERHPIAPPAPHVVAGAQCQSVAGRDIAESEVVATRRGGGHLEQVLDGLFVLEAGQPALEPSRRIGVQGCGLVGACPAQHLLTAGSSGLRPSGHRQRGDQQERDAGDSPWVRTQA